MQGWRASQVCGVAGSVLLSLSISLQVCGVAGLFFFSLHLIAPASFPCLAGLMYTGVGLLRLGWLTNFLSHTTISGFMSGACIVIALSQVGGRHAWFILAGSRWLDGCWVWAA